jgi:hypothetical protein
MFTYVICSRMRLEESDTRMLMRRETAINIYTCLRLAYIRNSSHGYTNYIRFCHINTRIAQSLSLSITTSVSHPPPSPCMSITHQGHLSSSSPQNLEGSIRRNSQSITLVNIQKRASMEVKSQVRQRPRSHDLVFT